MNYKKIFKNQEIRFKILKLFRFVPSIIMIKFQYFVKLGRIPNLKNSNRFTEKLQLYKLKYQLPLMTIAADKYEVRNFISSKNLSEILVELYGVYDSPEEIRYDELPNSFVIKTTNGSGTNIICKDKSKLNRSKSNLLLNDWLRRDYYAAGREWAYKNIKPRIVIEEFLIESKAPNSDINDYKILCFNGEPKYIIVDIDRSTEHKRNIYSTDWTKINVETDKKNFNHKIAKPEKLTEMLEIARSLSENFPFVRVDLYLVNNKIYFGELTFYPWTGYVQFKPDSFDYELGKHFSMSHLD